MRVVIIGLILLFSLVSFGCGGLQGPQLKKSDLLAEMEISKPSDSQGGRPVICVKPFTITRGIPDPHVVGEAWVGAYLVAVESENPVDVVVMDQVKQGFSKAGFKLGDTPECGLEISGRIERLWVSELRGGFSERAKAAVRYDLIIRDKNGKFLWGDTIEGRASDEHGGDITKYDVPTLVKALNKSVESIFTKESFWGVMRK